MVDCRMSVQVVHLLIMLILLDFTQHLIHRQRFQLRLRNLHSIVVDESTDVVVGSKLQDVIGSLKDLVVVLV